MNSAYVRPHMTGHRQMIEPNTAWRRRPVQQGDASRVVLAQPRREK